MSHSATVAPPGLGRANAALQGLRPLAALRKLSARRGAMGKKGDKYNFPAEMGLIPISASFTIKVPPETAVAGLGRGWERGTVRKVNIFNIKPEQVVHPPPPAEYEAADGAGWWTTARWWIGANLLLVAVLAVLYFLRRARRRRATA